MNLFPGLPKSRAITAFSSLRTHSVFIIAETSLLFPLRRFCINVMYTVVPSPSFLVKAFMLLSNSSFIVLDGDVMLIFLPLITTSASS